MSTTLSAAAAPAGECLAHDLMWRRARAASVVDALGTGLLVPLELLFLHVIVGLGLTAAGGVMSCAALLGLLLLPAAGPVLDRLGPRQVILTLALVRCAALGGCALVSTPSVVVALVCLAAVADRWDHPAQASLVSAISATREERDLRLAVLRGLRNGCMTGGALLAALVAVGGATGYRLAVGVDALSFGVSAAVVATVVGGRVAPASQPRAVGYRRVLRDPRYVRLTAANIVFALGYTVLVTGLPAYLIGSLGAPTALGALAFAVNTALVASGQQVAHRLTRGRSAGTVTAAGGLVFAASFLGFAALTVVAGHTSVLFVGTVLVTAAYTLGELLHSAGSTTLSLDLAPATGHGRHLAFFQLSWAAAPVVGPAVFTWLAGAGGLALWVPLAIATLVASSVVSGLSRT